MPAFDHVAIEVADLDGCIELFERLGAMQLLRRGVRTGSGQRIAMLVDERGQKLELVEGGDGPATLLHIAFDVHAADDVERLHDQLVDGGCASLRPAHVLAAAKATTSLVRTELGVEVQLVHYADDSPDQTRGLPS